jgi:NADH-quinone oxidoreductase E subunit
MQNETALQEIHNIQSSYPDRESALLPALYIAQREFGWLSNEALLLVAKALSLPEARVRGTASFYSMFKHKPVGRNLVQICTNISCMIAGSDDLVGLLKSMYGMEPNETTPDKRFSLVIMECIGACGTAPAMLVNTDFHDNLTEKKIGEILEKYT